MYMYILASAGARLRRRLHAGPIPSQELRLPGQGKH